MGRELKYTIFPTDMGWTGIIGSTQGLLSVTLPQRSSQEALKLLGDRVNQAIRSPETFNDLTKRLRRYFSGQKTGFPDKLDLSGATLFQHDVWQATRLIPYGESRSYAWVADQINKPKATRAVGQALGKNPLPVIIPCHRVIASDGKLGGFSGGLEMKRRLLQLEASDSIRL